MKLCKQILVLVFLITQSTNTIIPNHSQEKNNNTTLQAYEQKLESYLQNTPQHVSGNAKIWIDRALSYIDQDSAILEIGSAFGRDADYIESHGYQVQRSDAAESFVHYLQNQGHDAQNINILTDSLSQSYDMVFANGVFLHFSRAEFKNVLNKLHNHLYTSGILAFSIKKGIGEEWSEEKLGAARYYCYWMPHELNVLLEHHNFNLLYMNEHNNWIHIIAQKK